MRSVLLAIAAAMIAVMGCKRAPTVRDRRLLQEAVTQNQPDLLRELLARGVDPDTKFDDGMTPLIEAALDGHPQMLKILLRAGADPNLEGGYFVATPVHYVRSPEVARVLIEGGARVDTRAEDGRTAIHHAALIDNVPVAKVLLQKVTGTTVNAVDERGETPLHIAADKGNKDLISLFFKHGAKLPSPLLDATARGDEGTAIALMKQRPKLLRDKDSMGWSVLHWAAALEREEVIKVALARGAPPDPRAKLAWSPLQYACLRGNVQIARMLLEQGAKLDPADKASAHLLAEAASKGNLDMTRLLLEQGVPVEDPSRPGRMLCLALYGGSKEVLELLLSKGAVVDAKGSRGGTPLHAAAELGRDDLVSVLLRHGADVNAKDGNGKTPIDVAEEKGNKAVVELLGKHGAKE